MPIAHCSTADAGELCFCFIGQVSSRTGVPLVVDAHAISFRRGGGFEHCSLRQAWQAASFERLVNAGRSGHTETAQLLIPAAVEASLAHLQALQALSQRYFRAKTQALDEEDPTLRAKAGEEVAGRRLYENLEVVYQVANVCPILLSTGNLSFDSSSLRLSERAIIGNHIRARRIGAVWHGESLPSTVDSHRGLLSALSHGCSAGF